MDSLSEFLLPPLNVVGLGHELFLVGVEVVLRIDALLVEDLDELSESLDLGKGLALLLAEAGLDEERPRAALLNRSLNLLLDFLLCLALLAFVLLHFETPLLRLVLHSLLQCRLHRVLDAVLLRNAGLILEVLLLFGFAFAFELLSTVLHGQCHALCA